MGGFIKLFRTGATVCKLNRLKMQSPRPRTAGAMTVTEMEAQTMESQNMISKKKTFRR